MSEVVNCVIDNIKYECTSETTCKVVGAEWGAREAIIPEEVTIDGKQYKVTAVGTKAFSVSRFERIELPVGITEIEDNAFECWYLKSVKLPDGLTVMGNLLFNCCKWIETVEIPDSVKSIGQYTFRGCEKLKKVNLPSGLEELSDSLFCDCKSLESVDIPDTVKKLGEGVFYGCEKLKKVNLPNELTEIDRLLFYECKSLESIEIPDTVKSIGDYAFYECEKLTTVDLPSGLLSLGEGAFKGCLALEHIELPQSLTQLGDMALANCPLLGEVVLPPGIALEEVNYGFEEDSSKEVVDDSESCTESEFQYSKKDKMFMNSVKVEEEIINIWSYRGELVKLYPDKIMIGNKTLPVDSKKCYCCENDVLTCEDDDNFYVYDGEEFVHTECKYRNHNDYFSSDIFCSTMIDRIEDVQCVALTDHGEETSFKFKFRCSFSEYHYFAKTGVFLFVETFYPKLRFFSKDGEELWYLEPVDGDGIRDSFSYVVDTLNMDFDGDGIIVKIQKGEQCYTVCYHVGSGEVLWYRKDNHPFLFAGAKCEDGLMRGVFPYYEDGEYCTVMFEINPSNGKASTYRISDSEKAKEVTVEGFKTRSVQYKYILDGEILYAIGTDEIIVVDTQKKVIISRKKAPENVPYRQEDAVLFDGKLYVCLMFDGGFLPVWKCYELSDTKVVEKKAEAPAEKSEWKNEMMTNEELAAFEKEEGFELFNSEYIVYPGYTMRFLIKSPKTCAAGGIEKVTEKNLHLEIPASVEINGNTYWVNEIFAESFWGNDYIETVTIPDTVTCIDYGAFNQCGFLKNVYIPDSVASIDELAFTCCKSLKSVSLPANVELDKDSFDRRKSLVITRRESVEPVQVNAQDADQSTCGVSDKKNEALVDENKLILNGKKTFSHDNFNELDEMDKLQVLTGCECTTYDYTVESYFRYREQGKKEGFIPVIVATDDIYFEQLEIALKCDGETSISKIQEIVEAYHKKMLAAPVEDGKAYLEENHISAQWDDDEFDDEEEYEAEEEFTKNGYLVIVPVTEPWRIWAYLPYGGWNACPKVSEHMAVSKYWYDQYGAYPAAMSYNTIDYAVEVPPGDLEKLANEVGTYCFDIVEQGCETYSALAVSLKNSRIWNFWWD